MSIVTQGYATAALVLQGYGASVDLAGADVLAVRRLPARVSVVSLENAPMDYSGVTAREPIIKHPADIGLYVLGFEDVLPAGESIDEVLSATSALVAGTGTLAVGDEEPTSEPAETTWGHVVPVGRGVRFSLAGGADASAYKVSFVVRTDEGTTKAGAVFVEVHA